MATAAVPFLRSMQMPVYDWTTGAIIAGSSFGLGVVLYYIGKSQTRRLAATIAETLARARQAHDTSHALCQTRLDHELQRIETQNRNTLDSITRKWGLAIEDSQQITPEILALVDQKKERAQVRGERMQQDRLQTLERSHAQRTAAFQAKNQEQLGDLEKTCAQRKAGLDAQFQAQWDNAENRLEYHAAAIIRSPLRDPGLRRPIPRFNPRAFQPMASAPNLRARHSLWQPGRQTG